MEIFIKANCFVVTNQKRGDKPSFKITFEA